MYNQGILPERTADSMKNFYKKNLSKTLEEFLIDCIHEGNDFCLSFKEIPNPDFEPRFRQKYESEFTKLQALYDLDGTKKPISSDIEDDATQIPSGYSSTTKGRASVENNA